MKETIIWQGSPSQWTNFGFYLLCIPLTVVAGLGLIMGLWRYYYTKKNALEITDQRIIEHKGIISKSTNEIELYRVKDIRHLQPFWLRQVGLSNIWLDSTDHSNPVLLIRGIKDGREIKEKLRLAIDARRDIKGVREVDFKQ
ncbi:PH domain-containing protein [Aggregatimonas sangjinii]|uniref:PH domain-containing protein n=1 Tax=Aggregatimonas sangjinii TaxID=2583587 RepID=A0A5B7SQ42_9FLAO|nr:PH domain-containing protein [Aggregatimonas sangjinii]QCX00657.1 PH domain-containing protein [Aggregatimonas sangjinii]